MTARKKPKRRRFRIPLREFWIIDATDNSGYHVSTKPCGNAVNVIHVREVKRT